MILESPIIKLTFGNRSFLEMDQTIDFDTLTILAEGPVFESFHRGHPGQGSLHPSYEFVQTQGAEFSAGFLTPPVSPTRNPMTGTHYWNQKSSTEIAKGLT